MEHLPEGIAGRDGGGAVTHIYLGDRLTAPEYRDRACTPVRRPDGKCIRARNGNMLVQWADGTRSVVVGRRLRKLTPAPGDRRNGGDGRG